MRVVGGRLRGRNIAAPASQAIRPTADRLRETLFNVVMHGYAGALQGARVLDLFAGTGALGIEAISRGAVISSYPEKEKTRRCCKPLVRSHVTKNDAKRSISSSMVSARCGSSSFQFDADGAVTEVVIRRKLRPASLVRM